MASSVVVGASLAANTVVTRLPKGHGRDLAEKYVTAPGQVLYEKLEDNKDFRKWRKKGDKAVDAARVKIEDAADRLDLPHKYNTGAWAVVGFAICFLMTLLLGVSSLRAAISLGIKVTLLMVFLQGALVFAGILAYQKLTAG